MKRFIKRLIYQQFELNLNLIILSHQQKYTSFLMNIQLQPSHDEMMIFDEFINDLMTCLEDDRKPQYYIPEERQIVRLKNNLISNTFIVYGSSSSGKTSSVYWAASEQPQVVIILINCDIDTTQQQFIQSLTENIKKHSKLIKQQSNTKKNNIIFQNMKFDELNQHIKSSEKQFVFVIKKCEQIAQMKKPTLFYNLLEWVNGSMKPYLGLVFLSRAFHFTDSLQKRVKSRLNAKSVTLIRPQGQKIIKIYLKRFQTLKSQITIAREQQKKGHKRRTFDLRLKLQWLNKIMKFIETNKEFKDFVSSKSTAINNQFLTCMRVALLKNLKIHQLTQLNQKSFHQEFMSFMQDATLHISPSYVKNLILQCPLYSILVLSLITYMGLKGRSPYKMTTIFDTYKQLVLNNSKFNHITTLGSSKILFEKGLQKLLDIKVVMLAGEEDTNDENLRKYDNIMSKQLSLSLTPQDLQLILYQMTQMEQKNIPQAISFIINS